MAINRRPPPPHPLLAFRFWGEECVVYHRLSGDTHLLPARHAEILQRMAEGVGGDRLIDHLVAEHAMDHEEAAELSALLLSSYRDLGLIDPGGG